MATLITGITGLLGTALELENRNRRQILGIYLGDYQMADSQSVSYANCDVRDKHAIFNLLADKEIECIVHAAGLASTDLCERNPELAYSSNIIGTENIIELAREKDAQLVYISTNAVFDGKHAPYSEEMQPHPINRYGSLKLQCETMIKEKVENYLIIRPILMYGPNNPHERKSFFTWVWEKLRKEEEVNIVSDVFENPLLSKQCANVIWKLIDKGARGIFHVAGKDTLSRYEAARILAEVFGRDASLLKPVSSEFFPTIAPRPRNTSYNTTKVEDELGVKPLGFRQGLSIFKQCLMGQVEVNQ